MSIRGYGRMGRHAVKKLYATKADFGGIKMSSRQNKAYLTIKEFKGV